MSNIRPLHDWIAVKCDEVKTTTDSGIILTTEMSEKVVEAVVLAAGPGCYSDKNVFIPVTAEIGQKVAIVAAAIQTFETDDGELSMIKEDSIIGVIS